MNPKDWPKQERNGRQEGADNDVTELWYKFGCHWNSKDVP